MKRKVTVELVNGDTWKVFYVGRRKYGRYSPAQFYAKQFNREYVENWVRSNPKLELVTS